MPFPAGTAGLARASHLGPTVAVTTVTALLAAAAGHDWRSGLLVTAAVGTGQLTIGWSNDLVDADRDRQVGRRDKPVALGEVGEDVVRGAVAVALVACVGLSLAAGLRSAGVHLLLVVGSGWGYNLGLKRTAWSALPYAVAFGSLPAVVSLALPRPAAPAPWLVLAGALLGVGAHLLNALPDLADDARTGVDGLPQRLGARRSQLLAALVLVAASAVTAVGPGVPVSPWPWAGLGACLALGTVAARGSGRVPFLAAVAVALVDVLALLLRR